MFSDEFKTWDIEIDFDRPDLSQNELVEITNAVEAECPVGKAFGVEGVGEGVVWTCVSDWTAADGTKIKTTDLIFKVKGPKHSDTKVKKLAEVDVEKVNSIMELATNVVTDHRLEKMLELMKLEGVALVVESTPRFLMLVGQDILKEEADTIEASGLNRKDIMGQINRMARDWYLTLVKSQPL